jgi:four helix bundle protein
MAQQGYKDLIVWQKSMQLVKLLYDLCDQLPKIEQYILISQMLRAVISIPSNIAEGWSRHRKLEFIRFLEISFASCCELETQIIICQARYPKFAYDGILDLICEVKKMTTKLIQYQNSLT